MSYIDLFKHKHVGNLFNKIAIYKALEDIEGYEFNAKKGQFILGGGGGEHPGAVIGNINEAAEIYLDFTEQADLDWNRISELHAKNIITYDNWSIETCYEFYKTCLEAGYKKGDGYIDFWVVSQIVQLVIENDPEAIDKNILNLIN